MTTNFRRVVSSLLVTVMVFSIIGTPLFTNGYAVEQEVIHSHNFLCHDNYDTVCEKDHEHRLECYTGTGEITCGLDEGSAYSVGDVSRTEWGSLLTCSVEEHTHNSSCYAQLVFESDIFSSDVFDNSALTCSLAEHTHSDDCYSILYKESKLASSSEEDVFDDSTEDDLFAGSTPTDDIKDIDHTVFNIPEVNTSLFTVPQGTATSISGNGWTATFEWDNKLTFESGIPVINCDEQSPVFQGVLNLTLSGTSASGIDISVPRYLGNRIFELNLAMTGITDYMEPDEVYTFHSVGIGSAGHVSIPLYYSRNKSVQRIYQVFEKGVFALPITIQGETINTAVKLTGSVKTTIKFSSALGSEANTEAYVTSIHNNLLSQFGLKYDNLDTDNYIYDIGVLEIIYDGAENMSSTITIAPGNITGCFYGYGSELVAMADYYSRTAITFTKIANYIPSETLWGYNKPSSQGTPINAQAFNRYTFSICRDDIAGGGTRQSTFVLCLIRFNKNQSICVSKSEFIPKETSIALYMSYCWSNLYDSSSSSWRSNVLFYDLYEWYKYTGDIFSAKWHATQTTRLTSVNAFLLSEGYPFRFADTVISYASFNSAEDYDIARHDKYSVECIIDNPACSIVGDLEANGPIDNVLVEDDYQLLFSYLEFIDHPDAIRTTTGVAYSGPYRDSVDLTSLNKGDDTVKLYVSYTSFGEDWHLLSEHSVMEYWGTGYLFSLNRNSYNIWSEDCRPNGLSNGFTNLPDGVLRMKYVIPAEYSLVARIDVGYELLPSEHLLSRINFSDSVSISSPIEPSPLVNHSICVSAGMAAWNSNGEQIISCGPENYGGDKDTATRAIIAMQQRYPYKGFTSDSWPYRALYGHKVVSDLPHTMAFSNFSFSDVLNRLESSGVRSSALNMAALSLQLDAGPLLPLLYEGGENLGRDGLFSIFSNTVYTPEYIRYYIKVPKYVKVRRIGTQFLCDKIINGVLGLSQVDGYLLYGVDTHYMDVDFNGCVWYDGYDDILTDKYEYISNDFIFLDVPVKDIVRFNNTMYSLPFFSTPLSIGFLPAEGDTFPMGVYRAEMIAQLLDKDKKPMDLSSLDGDYVTDPSEIFDGHFVGIVDTQGVENSLLWASASLVNLKPGARTGVSLDVNGDTYYRAEDTYTYNLSYYCGNGESTNVILFDSIEDYNRDDISSDFHGTLKTINLNGYTPTVYVSEQYIDVDDYAARTVSSEVFSESHWKVWTSNSGIDLSRVKSIAFDFGDTVFNSSNMYAQVSLEMEVPPEVLPGEFAYNEVCCSDRHSSVGKTATVVGNAVTVVVESDMSGEFPETGGIGTTSLFFVSFVLISAGAIGFFSVRRRRYL